MLCVLLIIVEAVMPDGTRMILRSPIVVKVCVNSVLCMYIYF